MDGEQGNFFWATYKLPGISQQQEQSEMVILRENKENLLNNYSKIGQL